MALLLALDLLQLWLVRRVLLLVLTLEANMESSSLTRQADSSDTSCTHASEGLSRSDGHADALHQRLEAEADLAVVDGIVET